MSRVWCVDCLKSYSRKAGWTEHFELKEVKAGGKLVTNQCYGRKRKAFANSLEEANNFKRLKPMNEIFKITEPENNLDNLEENIQNEVENLPPIDQIQIDQIQNSSDRKMLTEILQVVKGIDTNINEILSKQSKVSEKNISGSEKLITEGPTFDQHTSNIQSSKCLSVKSILENFLIQDIFEVQTNDETEEEYLTCLVCQKNSLNRKPGIIIEGGSNYSVYNETTGMRNKCDRWFSNFKKKVVKHLKSSTHTNSVTVERQHIDKVCKLKADIHTSMRHLAYYTLHSNTPFEQFPILLATVNKCGVNLGDINHTRKFIVIFLELVNDELYKKTYKWFNDQKEVTVTLDIGTVFGITLLATLFIGDDGNVKLVNVTPISSKKGADVATVCFESMKMGNNIKEEDLKEKIVGLTGDGAFAKLNKPFKNKISELLGKNVPIRWDILHLINRAHKDARGKTDFDDDTDTTLDDDEPDPALEISHLDTTEVSKLINYIQSEAKKYRSGIKYTNLVMTTGGKFKRPKVWSNTRMVVYEFEMLERFLENKVYFDHPQKYLILAKVYCLVMFSLKIILKCVQKTNISQKYVKSVILDGHGKKAMNFASQVALDVYNNNSISYLLEDKHKEKDYNVSVTKKGLAHDLYDYIESKPDLFNIENEEPKERVTRHAIENEFTIDHAKEIADAYTDALWVAINKRLEYADLADLSSCAFSEAPAESVFSVYARVTDGRESLTVNHAVCLLRVSMHGPPPSTTAAEELAGTALANFNSHLGERFCTQMWFKGKTSKTIKNQQDKNWKW